MAIGYRRRLRTAIVVAALLAIPSTAFAATDPAESVIVTLRGGPASVRPFAGTTSGRGSAVARALQQDLGRRGRGLRATLAGRATSIRPLWIAGGYAVTAPRSVVATLRSRPDVASVTADATAMRPAAEPGIDLLAAPAVWSHLGAGVLQGTRGAGVTVAILDTGLDIDGPLASRYRGGPGAWLDPYGTYSSPVDGAGPCSGHGTAVGGVIAGDLDDVGVPYGVAPDAALIAARIFDNACHASASAHAAFQWALDPDGDPDTADAPAVVNASWGAPASVCDTTFQPDLAALRAAGIVVVVSAGNATVPSSPATLSEAFAVGALDETGNAARPESGQGVSPCDGRTFPDLAAPGTDVRTANRGSDWQTVSGTSVAAPHVTGALALLLARHPGLTADEQTNALLSTAQPLAAPGAGAGRVDALAAFESALPSPRDVTGPILSLPVVAPAIANGAEPVALTATATDAVPGAPLAGTIAGVTLAVDDGPPVPVAVGPDGAIAAAIDAPMLGDGAHTAVLVATDDSGNVSRPRSAVFTVDRVAPVLSEVVAARDDAGHVVGTATAGDGTAITAASRRSARSRPPTERSTSPTRWWSCAATEAAGAPARTPSRCGSATPPARGARGGRRRS